jgi:ABC-type Fe3+-hydroxamate transport system substrate-binding protein
VILRFLALAALSLAATAASATSAPYATPSQTAAISAKHRIVSLIPSLTEDLFAVGAGDRVVAVSEYTDYPPAARRLPVVSSFASVNTERIVALHPDLVVGIESQSTMLRDLVRADVPLMLVKDDSLADVYSNLQAAGTVTGRNAAAYTLIARLKARTAVLTRSAKRRTRAPSVFVVLGTAPIFTVGKGSYIASLIRLAGGRNAAEDIDAPYARYSAEALVARQPDALIVDPDIHFRDALGKAPWNALRAVRDGRVYTLPNAAILERPGPRYNDGLAWLIAALQKVPT